MFPSVGMLFLSAVLTVLLALGSSMPAFAQPTAYPSDKAATTASAKATISLGDLEQMALKGNPTLAQAAAKVEAAGGRALQAGLYPNPTVGYESDEIGAEGTAGQQGVFIEQVIVTGGKLRLSREKFQQEVIQEEWQALAQQYRVLNSVRMRFYHVLALQQLVEVQEGLLKVAQDAVTTTEELLNTGAANKVDVLQARVEARQQRVAMENARIRYKAAWQELAALVGQPCLPVTSLDGKLDQDVPVLDAEQTWCRLMEVSPELRIAQTEITRNQIAVRREEVEPIPNLRLRGSTQYNFDTKRQQAGIEIGLRLPMFDRNQGNILTAQAELNNAQADVVRVELSLRQRLAKTFARYQTNRTTVEEYRQHILPETKEAYLLYVDSFQKRRAAWPQVLVAQRSYFQANVEYLEALVDLRRAEVALLGLLLVDGLEEPPGLPSEGRGSGQRNGERLNESLSEPLSGRGGRGPSGRSGD